MEENGSFIETQPADVIGEIDLIFDKYGNYSVSVVVFKLEHLPYNRKIVSTLKVQSISKGDHLGQNVRISA